MLTGTGSRKSILHGGCKRNAMLGPKGRKASGDRRPEREIFRIQIKLAPIRILDVSINNQHGVPNGPRRCCLGGGKSYVFWIEKAKLLFDGDSRCRESSVVCTRHSIRNHDFRTPLPLPLAAKGLCALGERSCWGSGD